MRLSVEFHEMIVMNVAFYLLTPKKEISQLRIFITYGAYTIVNNRKKYIPFTMLLPLEVVTSQWDAELQQAKTSKTYPDGSIINNRLLRIKGKLADYENLMIASNKPIEKEGVKEAIEQVFGIKPKPVQPDRIYLRDIGREVIAKSESGERLTKEGNKIMNNVFRKYENALYHLDHYERLHGRVLITDLNKAFGDKLQTYFNSLGLAHNTKINIMIQYKIFLNYAVSKGLMQDTDYRKSIPPEIESDKIALTLDEVNRIYELNLDGRLENARDVFIVGIWTMLRWQDYSTLQGVNLDGNLITVNTTKTHEKVVLPIHWQLQEILNKYDGKFPEPYSQQKFNDALKEIGKLAEITAETEITAVKGGKVLKKVIPRYSLISSHTARRTGATMFYLAGVPKKQIMLLTGHTTEENFDRYIRIGKLANAQILSELSFLKKQVRLPVLEKEFKNGVYWAQFEGEKLICEVYQGVIYFTRREALAVNVFLNKGGKVIVAL